MLDRRPVAIEAVGRDCSGTLLLGYSFFGQSSRLADLLVLSVLSEDIKVKDNDDSLPLN